MHLSMSTSWQCGCGKRGMGWGFHIFQKFGIKFPTHRQIIPVKCNQISPPRAAPCCQITHGWTQRDNKNISVQIKLYNLFLKNNVAASPKIHIPVAIIRFNHSIGVTLRINTETFRRKSISYFVSFNIPFVPNEPYTDQLYWSKFTVSLCFRLL